MEVDVVVAEGPIRQVVDHNQTDAPDGVVVDLGGACLSPGWVDVHTHVFGEIGIGDPDAIGVEAGVTTVVDAGSAGPACLEDFWCLSRPARTEVLCFSYLESRGAAQIARIPARPADLTTLSVSHLVAGAQQHPEFVRGVKFDALADLGDAWVRAAIAIAEMVSLPVMAHIGNFPNNHTVSVDYVRDLLDRLRPGDIVTHVYTPEPGGLFDLDGRVLPEALEAQQRGVVMDLGYGYKGFSMELAGRGWRRDWYQTPSPPTCRSAPLAAACAAWRRSWAAWSA